MIYTSHGSLRYDLERLNELEYYDSHGTASPPPIRTICVLQGAHPYAGTWWPVGHSLEWGHTFVSAVHDFPLCLEEDRIPEPDFHDGVKVQASLEAVEASAASKTWQDV